MEDDVKKFVRQKILKYGLQSQRKFLQQKAQESLHKNGFVLPDSSKNCLFSNSGNESVKHFLVKALIFKLLRDHRRNVGTEVEVKGGIVDVLDLDNLIAYEVETELTRQKILSRLQITGVRDVFFIDTREISDNLCEAEKFLKEKVV